MRDYNVEVYLKYRNEHLFGWCLSDTSCTNAKYFAYEILAGMSLEEITRSYINPVDVYKFADIVNIYEPIGYDNAIKNYKIVVTPT